MNSRYSRFTLLISNINKYVNKIKSEEMEEFGLRSSHVSCLYHLYNHEEGLTASEICSLCDEDKGAMSRTLEYLESNDYIIYKDSTQKKKYRSRLFLTEKGHKVSEKIHSTTVRAVELGSKGITEKDRKIMYDSLEKVSQNLKIICDNYGGNNGSKISG